MYLGLYWTRPTQIAACVISALVLILMNGCTPKDMSQDGLSGRWIVVSAARNNRPTTTLEDTFFDFTSDSLLQTNVLRVVSFYPYKVKGNRIIQDGEVPIEYKIQYIDADSIHLSSRIKSYSFDFYMKRDTASSSLESWPIAD